MRTLHGLQVPEPEVTREVKVADLEPYKCPISEIMKLIGKEEPGEFFVRFSCESYDSVERLYIVRETKVPNPNYKKLLAAYNRRQKQFDQETKIFEELKKLYEEWNKERQSKNSLKLYKKLKKELEESGLDPSKL